MRIRWTTPASEDLEGIFDYVRGNYPHLARSTVVDIRNSVRSLRRFPHRGRKGSEEGTASRRHVIENLEDLRVEEVMEPFEVTREQIASVLALVAQGLPARFYVSRARLSGSSNWSAPTKT